ncbi:hypothetical protein [Microcoleus sp. B13-B6]
MGANYFATAIRSALVKVLGYQAIARDSFCIVKLHGVYKQL